MRVLSGDDAKRAEGLEQQLPKLLQEGRYADAIGPARELVALRSRVQGGTHWETLTAKSNLSTIEKIASLPAQAQADLKEALKLENEAAQLAIKGRNREAISLASRVVSIRLRHLGSDCQIVAAALNDVGVCHHGAGQYSEAEASFRRALAITQRVLGEEHPGTASCFGNLALSLQRQDRYAEAQSLLQSALRICLHVHGPDHPQSAIAYTNVASNLNYQGFYSKAEPLFRQALDVLRRAYGEEHDKTATAHSNLGFNLHCQAKDAEADREYRQALRIRLKLSGTDHPDTALVCNNLAVSLADQGKYAEAEPLYRHVLAVYGRVLGAEHPQTLGTCNNLALTLNQQGKLAEAEAQLRRALDHQTGTGRADNLSTATWCTNLAYNLQAQGRFPEAHDLLVRALAIRRKVLGDTHIDTAQSCNELAAYFYRQAEYDKAAPLFRDALKVFQQEFGDQHPLTAMARGNLAVDLYDQGKYAEAEAHQQKSLAAFRTVLGNGHPHTASAYRNSAKLAWARGDYRAAEELAREAGKSFDAARTRISFGGLDRAAFAAEQSPWPLVAALAARKGAAGDAWRALENNLARGLLDDLSARPLTAEQRDCELMSLRTMNRLDSEISLLLGDSPQSPARRERIQQLSKERDEVQFTLSQFHAELARKYGVAVGEVYELPRIQSQLAPDAALVAWLDLAAPPNSHDPNGEHWACVVRRQGAPAWIRLPGSGPQQAWTDDDDRLPAEVRLHCATRPATSAHKWHDLSRRLHAQRLSPIEQHLQAGAGFPAVRHLIILQATLMRGIPIEVLTDRYTVSYGPSGTLFAWLQEKRAARADKPRPAGPSILAVGDPRFDSRARNTTLSVPTDEPPPRSREAEFARLPAAERELRAVARVFPASTVLTGTQASKQSLDKLLEEGRLEQFRYLHFATHGVLDVQSPMRSALILAQGRSAKQPDQSQPDAPTTDNRLTAEQILRSWKLDADLVTLSACETGLGKFSGGEGYVGFSQALFLSGARSLVLSLWRVDDNSTALLMTRFYENLMGTRGGEPPLPKALALAEAKKWLRGLTAEQIEHVAGSSFRELDTEQTRGKRVAQPATPPGTPTASHPYDHPYYWSGFILIGDLH